MGFKKWLDKKKDKVQNAAEKVVGVALAPVKYVGGTTAKALGSDATFEDFEAGLHDLTHGKVSHQDVNRAVTETTKFTASIPKQAVRRTGKAAKDVVKEVGDQAGDIAKEAAKGIADAVSKAMQGALGGLFGINPDGAGVKMLRAGLVVGAVLLTGGVAYVVVREVGKRDVTLPNGTRVARA